MLAPPDPALAGRLRHADVRDRRWQAVGAVLLVIGLWGLTRPYLGIWHDAKLYAVLALARLDPANLGGDLFLRHGGQDSFTLFTPAYAWLIAHLGLKVAYPALLLAGQALWVSGAWRLISNRLLRGPAAIVALLLAIGSPGIYGAVSVFHIGESFLTPRLWAEALVLHALACRRVAPQAALLLLAAALHPIMALAGIGTAVVARILAAPGQLWWLLLAPLAALPLWAAGIPPFGHLFDVADPLWRAAIDTRAYYLLPSRWTFPDWANAVSALAVVAVAALSLTGARRRLLSAALIVAVGGVAATWLLGDRLGGILFLQAQLWRCAWLLHLLVGPSLVLSWLALRRHAAGPAAVAAMAVALVGPWDSVALAVVLAGSGTALLALRGHLRTVSPLLVHTCLALSAIVFGTAVFGNGVSGLWNSATALPAGNIVAMAALGALSVAVYLLSLSRPGVLPVAGAAALVAAAATWDMRSPWARLLEQGPLPVVAHFAPGSEIFWGNDPEASWFVLGRSSYVSRVQASGVVFSRDLTADYRRRTLATSPASEAATSFPLDHRTCDDFDRPLPRADLLRMCAPGGPDSIILSRPVAGLPAFRFDIPADRQNLCWRRKVEVTVLTRRYFAYDCAALRKGVS